jgi:Ran GTPase-activating protein (RanGAP) involved in mRNA processing and transport
MYSYNKVNVGIVATVSYASLSQKKCDDLQKICLTQSFYLELN